MTVEIWIPNTARPKFRCRVPDGEGGVCGKPFYDGEDRQFADHVRDCASQHEDAIHNLSRAGEAWTRPWDTERDRWLREHPGGW